MPLPAVTRILGRFSRPQMEGFIAVAIDLLDTLDGEPDLEASGDEQDAAWPERAGAGNRFRLRADFEDGEDDDPEEDDSQDLCLAGDDGCGAVYQHGVLHWGASQDDALRLPMPRFGVDQSAGELP
jgi:hypothetical protein